MIKKSLIGTRFDALARTRHNFSLVSNNTQNKLKSNSIMLIDKPSSSIEYKLPKEPESNRNKTSDYRTSLINDTTPKEIQEEDEYPEIQIEEVIPAGVPLTTEVAACIDLPKIKVTQVPENSFLHKSPTFERTLSPQFSTKKAKKEERKYSMRDLPATPKASFQPSRPHGGVENLAQLLQSPMLSCRGSSPLKTFFTPLVSNEKRSSHIRVSSYPAGILLKPDSPSKLNRV